MSSTSLARIFQGRLPGLPGALGQGPGTCGFGEVRASSTTERPEVSTRFKDRGLQAFQGPFRHFRAFQRLPPINDTCGPFKGASQLKPRHQPPKVLHRLEETGGLEPNPKPNLLLVATNSRLDSSKQKASSQDIAPAWSTRVEETKKKTGTRVLLLEKTGGLEPTPNPNLVLVWFGQVQLVQGKCPRPTRVFRQMPGAFRGLPGVRGLPQHPSPNFASKAFRWAQPIRIRLHPGSGV